MKTRWYKAALVSYLALLLTSCSQMATNDLGDNTTPSSIPIPPVVETPTRPVIIPQATEAEDNSIQMTQPTLPPLSSSMETLIGKAEQDLAERLGISVDSITVAAVIGQDFSTDAFYCRTTKERIAKEESPQVLAGHSIILNTSGRRYEYHASDQMVIFCQPLP